MIRSRLLSLSLLLVLARPGFSLPPIFFEENFSNNSESWAVWNNPGSGMWFRDGHYRVEVRGNFSQPSRIWNDSVVFDPARDFAIETRMTYVTGDAQNPNRSYWMMWGVHPTGADFYAFGIYPDGRFQYGKLVNNQWIAIINWTESSAVKTGENSTNVLLVERKKDTLYFSINGTPVHQAKYEPFHPSNKAVAFQGNGRVHFDVDYLRIYQEAAPAGNPYYGLKGLYPKFTAVPKDAKLYGYGYLFAGRVEGNVRDGDGAYLYIQKVGGNNSPSLQYWYYKGRFSENGRKFSGKRITRSIPLTLDKNEYRPKDGAVDVANLEQSGHNGFTGDFIVLPTTGGFKDLPSFVIQGRGERDLWAMERFKWKQCSGFYHWSEPVFLTIDYDGTRTFRGLVTPDYRPIAGVMDYGNGHTYEGGWLNDQYYGPGRLTKDGQVKEGIWTSNTQLASEEKVFVPSVDLLFKAASNPGRNVPFNLKLNPFFFAEGGENGFAGKVHNERGEVVGDNHTGPGLIFSSNKFVYFGGFKDGQPDGTGYYRVERNKEANYSGGPNVYAGTFAHGHFLAGASSHRTKANQGFANKQAVTPVHPGGPEFQAPARLVATGRAKEGEEQFAALVRGGNTEAGYWLGKLYQDGAAVARDMAKAVGYYQASANGNYLPSIIALGLIYSNGMHGIAADRGKAMQLMKQGATLPASAGFSQESIDYCRGNYFVLKYPFLRYEQAVKYSLADEADPASALAKTIAAEKDKFAAEEARKAEQARAQARAREEFTVSNNKHGWIKGTYLQNQKTKWIYHVSPNRPLYEGNLVEISIRFEDTKQTDYAYERLEKLLDENLYKKVVGVKRCDSCYGRGYTSRSYNRTVADYEYTLGKKIVQTTTHRDACGTCGGCGLVGK